jgi:NADPH2 dehydrogenase
MLTKCEQLGVEKNINKMIMWLLGNVYLYNLPSFEDIAQFNIKITLSTNYRIKLLYKAHHQFDIDNDKKYSHGFIMSTLFTPLTIGRIHLQHRVVMAPVTRFRASDEHVPLPIMAEYYGQRASEPGTLLITEATYISPRASGYNNAPALYTREQIEGWKHVTDAVHAKGSYIFAQLWAMGRAADPEILKKESGSILVAPSAIPMSEKDPIPREMNEEEIYQFIQDYARAARAAVFEAGFDGVEVHAANGYLIPQFLEEGSNQRTDGWGGSIEKRSRFALEVTKAVVEAVGSDRVGIRMSPWSKFQGMRLTNPIPQYSHFIKSLKQLQLAYLSLTESRVDGTDDAEFSGSLNPFLDTWQNTSPVLLAGGYNRQNAEDAVRVAEARGTSVAVMFGRFFTSNPDLPHRIRKGLRLTPYNRDDFYRVMSPIGYVDQPFYEL